MYWIVLDEQFDRVSRACDFCRNKTDGLRAPINLREACSNRSPNLRYFPHTFNERPEFCPDTPSCAACARLSEWASQ